MYLPHEETPEDIFAQPNGIIDLHQVLHPPYNKEFYVPLVSRNTLGDDALGEYAQHVQELDGQFLTTFLEEDGDTTTEHLDAQQQTTTHAFGQPYHLTSNNKELQLLSQIDLSTPSFNHKQSSSWGCKSDTACTDETIVSEMSDTSTRHKTSINYLLKQKVYNQKHMAFLWAEHVKKMETTIRVEQEQQREQNAPPYVNLVNPHCYPRITPEAPQQKQQPLQATTPQERKLRKCKQHKHKQNQHRAVNLKNKSTTARRNFPTLIMLLLRTCKASAPACLPPKAHQIVQHFPKPCRNMLLRVGQLLSGHTNPEYAAVMQQLVNNILGGKRGEQWEAYAAMLAKHNMELREIDGPNCLYNALSLLTDCKSSKLGAMAVKQYKKLRKQQNPQFDFAHDKQYKNMVGARNYAYDNKHGKPQHANLIDISCLATALGTNHIITGKTALFCKFLQNRPLNGQNYPLCIFLSL